MRQTTTLLASLLARNACTRALFLAAFATPLLSGLHATALVVSTYNGPGTPSGINNTAPIDDPGWANSNGSIRSGIYLGNQWMLTANHVATRDVELPGGTYSPIPGTDVILTNPATFLGQSLNGLSDLKMFRIDTHPTSGLTPEQQDPNIKEITIATQTPSLDTEVMAISSGNRRLIHPSNPNGRWRFDSNYDFTTNINSPHTGFLLGSNPVKEKTWGTNRISNPNALSGVVDNGLNALIEAVGLNDTVGLVAKFDPGVDDNGVSLGDGATDDEFQGAAGDSGGGVFAKNGSGDWELLGIFHAIYLNDGQSNAFPIFGSHSSFTDLSFQHYYDQLTTLRASNNYSVIGDIDLDGVVTGEIINGVPTGDLAALVDGWLYNQAEGDIVSWKEGDLNQDGFTDLSDFVLLRDALGGTISTSAFALLVSGVPEPSTALLALLGVGAMASRRQRS